MTILVTGANGMIGSRLVQSLLQSGYRVIGVDRAGEAVKSENYTLAILDLADAEALKALVEEEQADRIIHLAALAHTAGEPDLSWDRYYHVNVECAQNVFAAAGDRPVLYISTVDVYGFYDGKEPVTPQTEPKPVTNYGKSKKLAEDACRELKHYTIFRFSPVYTETQKRDIQKRYYLKYPKIAYQIGKGTYYEVLYIDGAVSAMVDWCMTSPRNDIRIIKNETPMWTPDYLKAEKSEGRAKIVLRFPRWMIRCGYAVLKCVLGKGSKTYLLNKAVYPLRSES